MTDREIMQQALDALQTSVPTHDGFLSHCKAMNHLRIRLAQLEQKPVPWESFFKRYCPWLEQPEQESCGWQFYAAGKWHNGMEANDHRVNTEAAGIPTRNVYPGPVAQPEQEPVAWQHRKPIMDSQGNTRGYYDWLPGKGLERWPHRRLYTAPPQRKPLTDDEVVEVLGNVRESITGNVFLAFARAIEAAHGIKENT